MSKKLQGIGQIIAGILVLIFQQMFFPTMYLVVPIGDSMESAMGSVIMTVIAVALIILGAMRLRE